MMMTILLVCLGFAVGVAVDTIMSAPLPRMRRKPLRTNYVVREDGRVYVVRSSRRDFRRLVRADLRLLMVDYLQIVRPEDSRVTRERQVASMAEELKSLARELRVPVLVLAQLNREAVKEGGGGAEHLRESDVIGQAADMVIRIDVLTPKPKKKNEDQQPDEYWLRVVKNRNSAVGKIRLLWNPSLTTFDSFERPVNTMANHEPAFEEYDGRDRENW